MTHTYLEPGFLRESESLSVESPKMIIAYQSVVDAARDILSVARKTILEEGTHLPTAILHTL